VLEKGHGIGVPCNNSGTPFIKLATVRRARTQIAVIRGASNLLRETHPMLIVEIDEVNQRRFGLSADDLLQELKGFGYSLSRIENEPGLELSFFNVLAIAPTGRGKGANKGAPSTS
jgi:hypothetical protein